MVQLHDGVQIMKARAMSKNVSDNLKVAQRRKFKCMGCGKKPDEIEYSFKKSGYFCTSCYEAVEFTVKLGLLIITPTMLLYLLSRMI